MLKTSKRDEEVFSLLADVFSPGLVRNCDYDDLEEVLEALRVLNPSSPRLPLDEVQLHIRRNDWISALHLLREIYARGNRSPLRTALQAWCLHSLRDPEWRQHVSTVLRNTRKAPAALAMIGRFMNIRRFPGATGDLRADITEALHY